MCMTSHIHNAPRTCFGAVLTEIKNKKFGVKYF